LVNELSEGEFSEPKLPRGSSFLKQVLLVHFKFWELTRDFYLPRIMAY
jgi:hypothetical protein